MSNKDGYAANLTKREHMALEIMCALIIDPSSDSAKDAVAGMAVEYADALLRQLEAPQQKQEQ